MAQSEKGFTLWFLLSIFLINSLSMFFLISFSDWSSSLLSIAYIFLAVFGLIVAFGIFELSKWVIKARVGGVNFNPVYVSRYILIALLLFVCPVSAYGLDYTYVDLDEVAVEYSRFVGNYLLVEAMSADCYYCLEQYAELKQVYQEFEEVQLLTLGIYDDVESMTNYIIDHPTPWAIGYDPGDFSDSFGIPNTPTMILFDANGDQVRRWVGLTVYSDFESYFNELFGETTTSTSDAPVISWLEELFANPMFRMIGIIVVVLLFYIKFGISSKPEILEAK